LAMSSTLSVEIRMSTRFRRGCNTVVLSMDHSLVSACDYVNIANTHSRTHTTLRQAVQGSSFGSPEFSVALLTAVRHRKGVWRASPKTEQHLPPSLPDPCQSLLTARP
jgi:hypothetical protein